MFKENESSIVDARIPLTVIGGYLGAGKTTLINRLLSEDHGLRLLVMVNDFGAINIDAKLLAAKAKDVLTLTNGCVCCTMGSDLFSAIGQVLDTDPRPDHIILEASGIADPAKIADVALVEPDLLYGGIVTVVDAENFLALSKDPQIGVQVCAQVQDCDLALVSKTRALTNELRDSLRVLGVIQPLLIDEVENFSTLLVKYEAGSSKNTAGVAHPHHVSWHYSGSRRFYRPQLKSLLARRPNELFRIKGFVRGAEDQGWLLQVIGKTVQFKKVPQPEQTQLIGIGISQQICKSEIDDWWWSKCVR